MQLLPLPRRTKDGLPTAKRSDVLCLTSMPCQTASPADFNGWCCPGTRLLSMAAVSTQRASPAIHPDAGAHRQVSTAQHTAALLG